MMKRMNCIVTGEPLEAGDPVFWVQGELVGVKARIRVEDVTALIREDAYAEAPPASDYLFDDENEDAYGAT